jgi:hypothetical protein
MDKGARQASAHHPSHLSSPAHHPPSPEEKHDFEFNKQSQKVNSMMQWQSCTSSLGPKKASYTRSLSAPDSAHAGSYDDF